nr:glycoside hydrolase family 97 N-terminal domain-containing protein [Polaribacter filamentus]
MVVNSPNEKVTLELHIKNEVINYQLRWDGELMMGSSAISLLPSREFTVKNISTRSADESWNPVWGKSITIRDHFNETIIILDFFEMLK